MNKQPELILKEDGFPVTAAVEGIMVRIIDPQEKLAWICLQIETHAHESEAVQAQLSEYLPPKIFQLAMPPADAHQIGTMLIDYAKRAVRNG